MLDERAEASYTVQHYGGAAPIDGTQLVALRRFHDDGGSMTELGRLSGGLHESLPGFEVRQVNFSTMDPGVIKAFHLHRRQTDVWFVPPSSKMLVVLGDARRDSPTAGEVRRIVMGDGTSQLLRIPPGVAHGVRNVGTGSGQIVYFVDTQFDPAPESCDEGRLPWDHFGTDVWEKERG